MKKMKKRTAGEIHFGRVSVAIVFFAVQLVIATYLILFIVKKNNAQKTGELLLNQIVGILEKNEAAEKTLVASLKEEYIIRANTVAYMLDNHPEAEYDIEELSKIANLMSIDEIHLFSESGVIYSGTRPEYYGFAFDSGEQISFFKPMLEDKNRSMCQDVMPNTAEGKEMMYAITWNDAGTRMIQVGIEPVRLLAELDNNKISNVVDSLPVYRDMDFFVADMNTGEILGATAKQAESFPSNIGAWLSVKEQNTNFTAKPIINGRRCICSYQASGQYLIAVTQEVSKIRRETILPVLMILLCMTIAVVVLLIVLQYLLRIRREQMDQLMILTSMSDIYYSMHLIDLLDNSYTEYSSKDRVEEISAKNKSGDAVATIKEIMYATMTEEYLERGLQFADLSTITERLRDKKIISMDLLGKNVGWIRMSFIAISRDRLGRVQTVICTTQVIDEEKRKEELLIRESITDNLTHCYNRREYENDLQRYENVIKEENFVFISMDVNGLKTVNDTLGHEAGDELLKDAAGCMQRCFGTYGKIYRTGGDEFAAVIYATEDKLKEIKRDFEDTVASYRGKIIQTISVSCGYVTEREFPGLKVREMARIADQRMYEAKNLYYKESGIERRKS